MIRFLSDEDRKLRNGPRRYGTHISNLNPEDIQCVGYWAGSFYVSEFQWVDFANVMRDAPWQLTWIGAPGWFAYDSCKQVYEWLAERYPMTGFSYGEWMFLPDWVESVSLKLVEEMSPA